MGSVDIVLPSRETYPDSQTYIWRCKDTNKRANYQINLNLFLVSSESIFEINLKEKMFFWKLQEIRLFFQFLPYYQGVCHCFKTKPIIEKHGFNVKLFKFQAPKRHFVL